VSGWEELLAETERLLSLAEPRTEAWEAYRAKRGEIFARCAAEPLPSGFHELAQRIAERDRALCRRLEEELARTRSSLAALAEGKRALAGYRESAGAAPRRGRRV
jgi:hypothetical protein